MADNQLDDNQVIDAECNLCGKNFSGPLREVLDAFGHHNSHFHPPPSQCKICGVLFDGTLPVQQLRHAIHNNMQHPTFTPNCSKCNNPNHNGTNMCPRCTESHCDVCKQDCGRHCIYRGNGDIDDDVVLANANDDDGADDDGADDIGTDDDGADVIGVNSDVVGADDDGVVVADDDGADDNAYEWGSFCEKENVRLF
jgi:hypothetical protein